jgi:hypothetical protein
MRQHPRAVADHGIPSGCRQLSEATVKIRPDSKARHQRVDIGIRFDLD